MCDALTGNTSQILWELKPDVTSQDIINLMCVRFGNAHDTERFRSELYSRNVAQGSPLLLFTRIYIGCWHLLFPVILTWNHGSSNTVAKHCMCPNCLQLLQEHAKVYAVCVVELLTACYFSRHSMHFCGNQSTPHQCMHK